MEGYYERKPLKCKGAKGTQGGPREPMGLFRSHSAWKAISSGGFFRKKSLGPEILQNATKTNRLKHLGGLGPEMVQSSTNPSEGYVSFNQPLRQPIRRLYVLQPTPPRGMCPSTNPSENVSFNQPFRGRRLQPEFTKRVCEEDTRRPRPWPCAQGSGCPRKGWLKGTEASEGLVDGHIPLAGRK